MEFSALKVKILSEAGKLKYPQFGTLKAVKDSGLKWQTYIDTSGLGWKYDVTSNTNEDAPHSPFGSMLGLLLVPPDFASQAVATFPGTCTKMNEGELAAFWELRISPDLDDQEIDSKFIADMANKKRLGIAFTTQQLKGLDPNDDTVGIRKNKNKTFVDFKAKAGITIKSVQGI